MKTETKINKLVSEGIENLVPYKVGKPMDELERELGITDSIKLASNENPLGPSPKAIEAVKDVLGGLNRYPDGAYFTLKDKLSTFVGVSSDMLTLGNGSNEIIELLIRTFITTGDEVIMGSPSFAVYPIIVKGAGGVAIEVPLDDLTIDLDAMADKITDKTKLIFIANPNNPTGTIVTSVDFDRFMEKVPDNVIVCMDEAYFEYVGSREFPDSLKYVKEGRSVVILRTFSKIYGLAGLRVGYGIATREISDYMNRVRQPFNVSSVSEAAAIGALDDSDFVTKSINMNNKGFDYLSKELKNLGFEVEPTEANFFLVKVGNGTEVYNKLLAKGVIVRPMKSYNMDEYLRITIGTEKENKRFIEAFKSVTD